MVADIDDLHGDGASFEGRGHDGVGEVEGVEHGEDVDGGEVEELDGVDEEDADAGWGFWSHFRKLPVTVTVMVLVGRKGGELVSRYLMVLFI